MSTPTVRKGRKQKYDFLGKIFFFFKLREETVRRQLFKTFMTVNA